MKKYDIPKAVIVKIGSNEDILNGSGDRTLNDMLDKTGSLDIQDHADW